MIYTISSNFESTANLYSSADLLSNPTEPICLPLCCFRWMNFKQYTINIILAWNGHAHKEAKESCKITAEHLKSLNRYKLNFNYIKILLYINIYWSNNLLKVVVLSVHKKWCYVDFELWILSRISNLKLNSRRVCDLRNNLFFNKVSAYSYQVISLFWRIFTTGVLNWRIHISWVIKQTENIDLESTYYLKRWMRHYLISKWIHPILLFANWNMNLLS